MAQNFATDEQEEQTNALMHELAAHDDIDAMNISAEKEGDGAIRTWYDVNFEMQMFTPPLAAVEQVAQDHGFDVACVGFKESSRDRVSVTLTQEG